jgi:hypothetical protein
MGTFPDRRHPPHLADAVGQAVADTKQPSKIRQQLLAGTFDPSIGPYDMPLETVRYYGKKELKRRRKAAQDAAHEAVSPEARNDPAGHIDELARRILTLTDTIVTAEVTKTQNNKQPDLDKLAKAANLLGKLQPLVKTGPSQNTKTAPKTNTPEDDLVRKLAEAAKTQPAQPNGQHQPVPEPPNPIT